MQRFPALASASIALLLALPALAQRPAEDQLKTLITPPGFEASLYASEPLVVNPSAIDIDTQGRVWVAEIQWYRAAAKQPPADQIKVLEDTDGDGRADKATVFAEGLFAPMSICVAGTKVYVATSPDLWVYEDQDGDLKADGPPTKLLTGFGGFNHDHGAHSLVLGPDHKWWMAHGDTGFNVTGVDGSHIEFRFGGMLRGELDGTKLELIAQNFRNPYEIAVNSFGDAFCSDNDNDGNFSVRICWILEGGDYGWFGGPPFAKELIDVSAPPGTPFREAWHFRGHIPGHVPGTLVTGFGSPCGMCLYEGDAFGESYSGSPIHADSGPREVRIYRHEKVGYGMRATSENIVTTEGDPYFRPDDVCTAPDGSLYVADWYDGGVGGHAYNDPTRGRIFRLTPTGKTLERVGRPGPYADVASAIEGLKNPNLATQFLARQKLLAEGEASVPALRKLATETAKPRERARALWVLDRIGGNARGTVVEALVDNDPVFRALAVRILRRHGEEYAHNIHFLGLAEDADAEVRREVLLSLRGRTREYATSTLARIAATYDGTDRYQLEAINIVAGDRKAELYAQLDAEGQWTVQKLPLMQVLNPDAAAAYVAKALAERGLSGDAGAALLALAGNTPSPEAARSLLTLAADVSADAQLRSLALARLSANLSGAWKDLAGDEQVLSTMRGLLSDAALAPAALTAIADNNLQPLAGDVTALIQDAAAEPALRAAAIRAAVRLRPDGLAAMLVDYRSGTQPAVTDAAIDGLVDLQDARALREVLKGASDERRARVVDRLLSTTGGAIVLLRFVDEGGALASALTQQAVSQAVDHPDLNVRLLFERFLPADQRPQRLGEAIRPAEILSLAGDAARGEKIFFQSSAAQCKNCHRVRDLGSGIGPDLSAIGKKYERAALLETILDPSKAIAPEYLPYLMETEAGQVYAGFLVEQTDQQVVLKNAKNELIRVPAGEVTALERQQKSLMPELVLKDVSAQDAADLLAFLESLKETAGGQ